MYHFCLQIEQLEVTLQDVTEQKSQLEGDLQHSREMVRSNNTFK